MSTIYRAVITFDVPDISQDDTGQCASRCISEHDTRQAAWVAGMAAMQQFPAVFSFCVTERTRTSSPAPCAALPVQLREAA